MPECFPGELIHTLQEGLTLRTLSLIDVGVCVEGPEQGLNQHKPGVLNKGTRPNMSSGVSSMTCCDTLRSVQCHDRLCYCATWTSAVNTFCTSSQLLCQYPKLACAMFPIWQVSYDTQPSNGSTVWRSRTTSTSSKGPERQWWMDCAIEMQFLCEEQLHKSKGYFSVLFMETVYLVDLKHMTQLNLEKGIMRKLRRLVLAELQNGCFKLGHIEKEDLTERAHKLRRII